MKRLQLFELGSQRETLRRFDTLTWNSALMEEIVPMKYSKMFQLPSIWTRVNGDFNSSGTIHLTASE